MAIEDVYMFVMKVTWLILNTHAASNPNQPALKLLSLRNLQCLLTVHIKRCLYFLI